MNRYSFRTSNLWMGIIFKCWGNIYIYIMGGGVLFSTSSSTTNLTSSNPPSPNGYRLQFWKLKFNFVWYMGYSNWDAMENLMLTSFTIILKRVQTEDLEYTEKKPTSVNDTRKFLFCKLKTTGANNNHHTKLSKSLYS
jgi:hypothetical protein